MQGNHSRVKTIRTKQQESFKEFRKEQRPKRVQSAKRFYLS